MPAPPPSTRPSIKVTLEVPRFSGTVLTSNRWYFAKDDGDPTDSQWEALMADLLGDIMLNLDGQTTARRADCYNAGSELVVKTRTLSTDGSADWSTGREVPSDCAGVIRFRTDGRTSRNHPIYLFKYLHAVRARSTGNPEFLSDACVASLHDMGVNVMTGITQGGTDGTVWPLCGPHGDIARDVTVLPEVRHRDFPR